MRRPAVPAAPTTLPTPATGLKKKLEHSVESSASAISMSEPKPRLLEEYKDGSVGRPAAPSTPMAMPSSAPMLSPVVTPLTQKLEKGFLGWPSAPSRSNAGSPMILPPPHFNDDYWKLFPIPATPVPTPSSGLSPENSRDGSEQELFDTTPSTLPLTLTAPIPQPTVSSSPTTDGKNSNIETLPKGEVGAPAESSRSEAGVPASR